MFKCSKQPSIEAFVLNIEKFDIRYCFEFRPFYKIRRYSDFCLNGIFRTGINYASLYIQNSTPQYSTELKFLCLFLTFVIYYKKFT